MHKRLIEIAYYLIRVKILSFFMVKVQKNTVFSRFIITFVLKLCNKWTVSHLSELRLKRNSATIKELFDSSLSSSNALLDSVVSHIRQRNGKMMRPILVLLVARLYGAICPSTLHAAVSLELLHTASLVHDDVVDESSERRGQLSGKCYL